MAEESDSVAAHECAYRVRTSLMHAVLEVLGDPWNLSILREVGRGVQRFDALVDVLGVSRAALSKRLDALVLVQCLQKNAYSTHPPRYEYCLSSRGRDVGPILLLLQQWNQTWLTGVSSQECVCHACQQPLFIDVICRHCRSALDMRQVKPLLFAPVPAVLPSMPDYRRTRHQLARQGRTDSALTVSAEEWLQDRWSALILGGVMMGLRRYGELLAVLEIAPNVLVGRLDVLQEAQLLVRDEGGGFRLTERGRALYPAIMSMRAWGERWLKSGESTGIPVDRPMEAGWGLLHRPCGEWLQLAYVCRHCAAEVVHAPWAAHDANKNDASNDNARPGH